MRARLLAALLLLLPGSPVASEEPPLPPVPRERLVFTLGAAEVGPGEALRVDAPKVRAEAPGTSSARAELAFSYLGPTAETALLASGEPRRQVGLKLRAKDGCNVLYVMWRLAPVPGLVVSVKENPGKRRHAECGARGYRTVRPHRSAPVPALVAGAAHRIAVEEDGAELRVFVDGGLVWEGRPFEGPPPFDGPVGLRTDNGRFLLELRAETAR